MAEAFRGPEDGTVVRMITGDPGRGAMMAPAVEDEPVADGLGYLFCSASNPEFGYSPRFLRIAEV
jgi:hypothetical protein